mgnify:FL=1
MKSAQASPPAVDLLSELVVPTTSAAQASTSVDLLAQVDLMSLTPPKATPPKTGGQVSLSGGTAKGTSVKDPFADLFPQN